MYNDDVIVLCEIDNLSEEIKSVKDRRRGVMRKIKDEDLRTGPCLLKSLFHLTEEILPGTDRDARHLTTRDNHCIRVDRICRSRGHDDISGLYHGECKMGKTFF